VAGTEAYLDQHSNGIPVIPMEYSMSQNYPNPFNPVTTIRYSLSNSGTVDLKIFNVLGQNVRTLVSEHQQLGSYSVTWDGKDNRGILLSSGIYYYQIQANNYRSVKKMTFIK
jgi:flagellar hook assembly protein FlgD